MTHDHQPLSLVSNCPVYVQAPFVTLKALRSYFGVTLLQSPARRALLHL